MRYFAFILIFLMGIGMGRILSFSSAPQDTLKSTRAQVLIVEKPHAADIKFDIKSDIKSEWKAMVSESASTAQSLLKRLPDFVIRKAYEERLQNRKAQALDQFSALGLSASLQQFLEFYKKNEAKWADKKKRAYGASQIVLKGRERRVEFFLENHQLAPDAEGVCFTAEVFV